MNRVTSLRSFRASHCIDALLYWANFGWLEAEGVRMFSYPGLVPEQRIPLWSEPRMTLVSNQCYMRTVLIWSQQCCIPQEIPSDFLIRSAEHCIHMTHLFTNTELFQSLLYEHQTSNEVSSGNFQTPCYICKVLIFHVCS